MGNLCQLLRYQKKLEEGSIFQTTIDSEVIVHLMAKPKQKYYSISLAEALRQIEGAYSLLILTNKMLIAVRDPNGFRPLVMGQK